MVTAIAKEKFAGKTWTVEEVKALLDFPRGMEKAIVAIYEKQTADEQSSENTKHSNGVGFTGADATILSSFAKQVLKGKRLSEKQLKLAEKKMPKYAKQLTKIANGKI